jgi:hypothetical protein
MFEASMGRRHTRVFCAVIFVSMFCVIAVSRGVAQNGVAQGQDQDKDRDNDEKAKSSFGGNRVKMAGKVRCLKADPAYSIAVPDRAGHSLWLEKRKCNWTEPLSIAGAKTKDGEADSFTEQMEGKLHVHSFEVDTLDNGEKLTWQSMGQVLAEKGPAEVKGRWSLMRGTGKLKGAKGGGTYEGKLDADGILTLELEGVYEPAAMAADEEKK